MPTVKSLPLEHLEFIEHIAVERVVDVQLDPVETAHAALKVFGKFVEDCSRRRVLHLRNNAVGPPALLSVVRRAYGTPAIRELFGEQAKVE